MTRLCVGGHLPWLDKQKDTDQHHSAVLSSINVALVKPKPLQMLFQKENNQFGLKKVAPLIVFHTDQWTFIVLVGDH